MTDHEALEAAGCEPDEIVTVSACGAARLRVRVYLKPEKQHCHASRDGECGWAYCPQLRDHKPKATGRHCPYDHWCYYCGEDEADGHVC